MAAPPTPGADSTAARRIVVALLAMGAAYAVLVIVFAGYLGSRIERIATDEALDRALDQAQRLANRLGAPGDLDAERLSVLQVAVEDSELLASVIITDTSGRKLIEKHARTPLGSGVRAAVDAQGQGRVEVEIDQSYIDRRTALLRSGVASASGVALAVGGLLILGAAGWIAWTAEQSRRALGARIQHERLAEVGAVAAGLAHEIRNPLNSLRLNLQLIEEDIAGGPERKLLAATRREVARLERLVEDFLRYARPRRPEARLENLGALIERAVESVRGDLDADGITLEVDAPSPAPEAELDGEQFAQVLSNLLRNAAEALRQRPPGDRRIRIELAGDGAEHIRLAVADSGPGLDPANLAKLGELFYSTKKGGTGLGLPIARRILEEHGGELQFASAPGKGLRAILRFPRRQRG